jgi:ADP-ribosylglycohydrolase
MLGAIIGDIVGSIYEFNNIKSKEFPLFSDKCFFTDDTVMTIAVAEAICCGGEKKNFIASMKKYGRKYPHAGYGGNFRHWLISEDLEPYNSYGNGSA